MSLMRHAVGQPNRAGAALLVRGYAPVQHAAQFDVAVRLNGLQPEDVIVEMLICRQRNKVTLREFNHIRFEFSGIEESGEHLYSLSLTPDLCGKLDYYIRVYPYQPLLTHPFEMGMMVWV